jgi:hypothetical protein
MKITRWIGLTILLAVTLLPNSQSFAEESAIRVHESPVAVLKAVFTAARTGELEPLAGLCDPKGENDGDTRNICALGGLAPSARFAQEFKTYFAKGRVNGAPVISGDTAKVPFLFGPNGTKGEEMNFVRRDGKWYLMSF